jgi:hypothetical protein
MPSKAEFIVIMIRTITQFERKKSTTIFTYVLFVVCLIMILLFIKKNYDVTCEFAGYH